MPGRDLALVLSRNAVADLDEILLYAVARWGEDQASAYRSRLLSAFERIRVFPDSGAARDDLRSGLRVVLSGQHAVLYEVRDDEVRVLRIRRQRLRPSTWLGGESL